MVNNLNFSKKFYKGEYVELLSGNHIKKSPVLGFGTSLISQPSLRKLLLILFLCL